MRTLLLSVAVATSALADEVMTPQPGTEEVGRFQLFRIGEVTLKLDSRTGSTWVLCGGTKKGPAKQTWCKTKDRAPYPAGPVGRYRLAEGTPVMLIDSVSGRVATRCDDPTPDKAFAWCPLEE